VIYDLLFRASAETLLEVGRDPRHLGAEIGFFSVLHTWNQKVRLHPHVHGVVPAGGLSLDHTRWVRSPDNYFLPKAVLRKVFCGKFVAALRQAFQNGELRFPEKLKLLSEPKIFAAWLRPLFRKDFVVFLKRPFGGPALLWSPYCQEAMKRRPYPPGTKWLTAEREAAGSGAGKL
jgi:hypothetical protein